MPRQSAIFQTVSQPVVRWIVDPDDPRAPPTEIWERLTPEQRAAVIEALPSEFPASEVSPPVPFADELIDRITRLAEEAQSRVERLEAELEQEQRRREEEQRRREEAEAEIARLRAELEKLRGR
jgi:hypothetical protein